MKKMNKKTVEFVNILDLKPKRRYPSEIEEGRVVVLVPKFSGILGRWFSSKLQKPYIRVKLDDFGSSVWHNCRESVTVQEIADRLKDEYGA